MGNEGSKPGGAGKGAESDGRGNSYRADEPVNPDGTAGEPIADPSNISELQDSSIAQAPQPKLTKDDFTLIKTIGKGSFGKVLMVKKNDTGKVYAMKVLNKEKVIARKQYEHTLSERKILQDISHPFLVGMHFAFQSTSKLYMVFDFFNGGELYSYVSKGKFNENRARFYTGEIALGIGHLHEHNIVYRDLKPENLLLDSDGHIKICDFGLSKLEVVDDSVKSICGTPEYLAPEVIRRQRYGKAVDWWSLGTLVYEMIAGLPPFYNTNRQKMYRAILDAPLKRPEVMSPAAFEVIKGFLQRDPTQRLGYDGMAKMKVMEWFSNCGWGEGWAQLEAKEVEPPFKPTVNGAADTGLIDPEFLREEAAISPTPREGVLVDQEAFGGFTYDQNNGEALGE
eukprot:INCI3850.1.p1 GENE.INCI3850.1~~INCI3850.1.p1  ORF type:complete len:396 (-),score=70.50 INCI3850.1:202-1389(-)